MSTRSATNKRTRSHEVTGVARKSAASAKPARQAASSVRVVPASSKARRKELEKGENLEGLSKEEKRARKAKQRAKEDRIYTVSNILLKQDEDYTKRRRIWWIVLAIGMVLVVAIWASLYFAPAGMVSSPVQMVGIVLSYVVILGDFLSNRRVSTSSCISWASIFSASMSAAVWAWTMKGPARSPTVR